MDDGRKITEPRPLAPLEILIRSDKPTPLELEFLTGLGSGQFQGHQNIRKSGYRRPGDRETRNKFIRRRCINLMS